MLRTTEEMYRGTPSYLVERLHSWTFWEAEIASLGICTLALREFDGNPMMIMRPRKEAPIYYAHLWDSAASYLHALPGVLEKLLNDGKEIEVICWDARTQKHVQLRLSQGPSPIPLDPEPLPLDPESPISVRF